MGIVSWIIWGFLVGLFARGIRPGRQAIGCWWTIALGIVGSLLGGFLSTEVLEIADADKFDLGSFLIAVLTSALLLGVWEGYARRRFPPER